ncbi:MAG: cytochrome c biogenesis protein CcsA [Gemmatimonadetes bacterium]|nr:cytochrome c biogenesis protein CcsA [Gemmatimonadota bacterium]
MTPTQNAERALRRSAFFMGLGLLLVAAVYVRALRFTPLEATQGPAQKIFYLHVPSAWVAFLAFGLVGVCSALYLFLKDVRLDRAAASLAEVGVVFTTVVLVTGPIWAKPIWGAWWTWDARLTSTLFLWFIYFGYLVLRSAVQEPGRRARYSAVLGILGSLLVPFIHVSVLLFRTLHPKAVVLNPSGPTLPGSMLATLLFALAVFTVFFFSLVAHRYAQATLAEARDAAREEADDAR